MLLMIVRTVSGVSWVLGRVVNLIFLCCCGVAIIYLLGVTPDWLIVWISLFCGFAYCCKFWGFIGLVLELF